MQNAWHDIQGFSEYAATPLHDLAALAHRQQLGAILYKDESCRFDLGSFKVVGAAYAVAQAVQALVARVRGVTPSLKDVASGAYRDIASRLTFVCATDGNHGRAVAWAASRAGCRCRVYLPRAVSKTRENAIAQLGAETVRVAGNYDEAVHLIATHAAARNWLVVSDTSYRDYREVPRQIMLGYSCIGLEVMAQLGDAPTPTHVIVQAGVGGLAATLCALFWQHYGRRRPRFIVTEPTAAACLMASARNGRLTRVIGDLQTIMGGLSCGEPSEIAWEVLRSGAYAFVTLNDKTIPAAMRLLARPSGADPTIIAGESGVAGLATLLELSGSSEARRTLDLDERSRILLIGTEGNTDPEIYRELVGLTSESAM
jgi:diaminopropionate ammonia-lyase